MVPGTTSSSTPRTILHVDMDAFFVAIEVLENKALAGKPVIVGGDGRRGVVAACSYEARLYGIHSAMPSTQARRLCPQAIFLPGHHELYSDYSSRLHDIFREFTPLVEGIALDEAFLDMSGAHRLFGSSEEIGSRLRHRIKEATELDASVGIASSKLIAKLASEAAKPTPAPSGPIPGAGVVVISVEEELSFLHSHPVRSLWGVGPATADRLQRFGVSTVGDLAMVPVDGLVAALGVSLGNHLHDLAWGRDDRLVEPERNAKSIGHEQTYPSDIHDKSKLHVEAVRLTDAVTSRLRQSACAARTINIKIRYNDFSTITRSQTLPGPVDNSAEVLPVVTQLLEEIELARGIRLFGVSVSGIDDNPSEQLSLIERDTGSEWSHAAVAIDEVRKRYGMGALGPAVLVGPTGLGTKRSGDQQWGPSGVSRDDSKQGD